MNKIWMPLVLILIIGVVAADLYFDSRDSLSSQVSEAIDLPVGTAAGELAPDFTGATINGESIRLSEYRGKVVLVNDFASWCGPCLAETPHLVETFEANQDKAIFIGLNLGESKSAVETYRDDFAIPYPLVLDPDGRLAEIYRPIGIPTSWFIDPDGVIRYVHAGPMTGSFIQQVLDAVKEGREPDFINSSS